VGGAYGRVGNVSTANLFLGSHYTNSGAFLAYPNRI